MATGLLLDQSQMAMANLPVVPGAIEIVIADLQKYPVDVDDMGEFEPTRPLGSVAG